MSKASAPSKSSGNLTISFGLANVPVKVYTATEDSKITRNRFVKVGDEFHEVGMKNYDKETGTDVAFSDLVLRYTTDDGTKVELTDEEIAEAVGAENGSASVEAFLPVSLLDSYVTETLLQVRPGVSGSEKKPSKATNKAFVLLLAAMKAEDSFALISYALRGKPRFGALTSDGVLRVLYFEDEIREDRELPEADYSQAEFDMARNLIQALKEEEAVEVIDTATARVRTYAEVKATGVEKEVKDETKVPVGTVDMMAVLEASIAAAKAKKASKKVSA